MWHHCQDVELVAIELVVRQDSTDTCAKLRGACTIVCRLLRVRTVLDLKSGHLGKRRDPYPREGQSGGTQELHPAQGLRQQELERHAGGSQPGRADGPGL